MKKQRIQRCNSSNDWDKPDDEWKPSHFVDTSQSSCPPLVEQDSLHRMMLQDSEGESDGAKLNRCPVCQKWFSRSAALFCHIKQNHRYVLSKPNENSIEELEKQTIAWKKRMKGEDSGSSSSNEINAEAGSSDDGKNSRNGSVDGRFRSECEDEDYDIEKYPIIGGSASISNANESFLSNSSDISFSFNNGNTELLDPDQSFSIVRRDMKKRKKKFIRQSKRVVTEKHTPSTEELVNEIKAKPVDTIGSKHVKNNDYKNGPKGKVFSKTSEKVLNSRLDSKTKVEEPVVNLQDFESFDFSVDSTHNDKKTHQCPVCSLWFSSSTLLTYHHMRKHMINEFRQCFKCGKVFYKSSSYKAHINFHEKFAL